MVFLPSFAEAASGGVPFEDEFSGSGIPALADADSEGGWADGMDERSGKRRSRPGPGGCNDKPEWRRGRFGEPRLAQEEEGTSGLERAPVKTPCRREVEPARAALGFEESHGKGFQPRRLLGDPERVPEPVGTGKEEGIRRDAEPRAKAGKIGKARLAENACRADPEERLAGLFLQEKACQREREARHRSRGARLTAVDLDETGPRQAAAEGRVEGLRACPQREGAPHASRLTVAAQEDVACIPGLAGRQSQPVSEDALDLRDFPAQGTNGLPRHGMPDHGGIRSFDVMFMLCSYGFQRPSEESSIFIARRKRIYSCPRLMRSPYGIR